MFFLSLLSMSFDFKDICYLLGIVFIAGGGWWKLNSLEKEDVEIWGVIGKLRDWIEDHEKDVSDKRIELEKDMARIRENAIKTDSNQNQLFLLVDKMDKKLDRIEIRLEVK